MQEEVTVMSVKGQVVIPMDIRKKLNLKPKDKLIVFGEEDTIIMKKLTMPELKQMWAKVQQIARERNKKYGMLTEEEVSREIQAHRHGR